MVPGGFAPRLPPPGVLPKTVERVKNSKVKTCLSVFYALLLLPLFFSYSKMLLYMIYIIIDIYNLFYIVTCRVHPCVLVKRV